MEKKASAEKAGCRAAVSHLEILWVRRLRATHGTRGGFGGARQGQAHYPNALTFELDRVQWVRSRRRANSRFTCYYRFFE